MTPHIQLDHNSCVIDSCKQTMLSNNSLVCLLIYWVVGRVALRGHGGDEFSFGPSFVGVIVFFLKELIALCWFDK